MADNYFGLTDTGRIRDNNEDNFIAEPVLNGNFIAACVIDGVGGYEGGEVAAVIARDTILSSLKKEVNNKLQALRNAFIQANRNIQEAKSVSGSNQHMACVVTMALVDLKANKFYYAHVGDTRLYLFRDQSLVKITRDQSFVGFLEDSGRINEAEAMNHPKRNEINHALGFDNKIETQADYIETGESPFLPGDLILLCSDGLSDMVANKKMVSILSANEKLEEKAGALIHAANEAGGKDNITVVLVKNAKKGSRQKATKPVLIKKSQRPEHDEAPPLPAPVVKEKKKKSNKGLIALLSILCLLSLATTFWLFREHFIKEKPEEANVVVPQNANEINFQDSVSRSAEPFLLLHPAVFGDTIKLTDTIFINRDSFYIKGPMVIFRDKGFENGGPAIVLGPECRFVFFDSLQFYGFDLAILSQDPSVLHMRDVQFNNTKLSIAYAAREGHLESTPLPIRDSANRNNNY